MSECQPRYRYIGGNRISNWSFYVRQTHSESCIKRPTWLIRKTFRRWWDGIRDGEIREILCHRSDFSWKWTRGNSHCTFLWWNGKWKAAGTYIMCGELSLPSKSQHFTHKYYWLYMYIETWNCLTDMTGHLIYEQWLMNKWLKWTWLNAQWQNLILGNMWCVVYSAKWNKTYLIDRAC